MVINIQGHKQTNEANYIYTSKQIMQQVYIYMLHSKLSPLHWELSSRKLGKEEKGLPERDNSHFVQTASYLNKCIKKSTSASLSIYFNWRRSDKNHTTTKRQNKKNKKQNPKMPFSKSTFPDVFDPSLHKGNTYKPFSDYIEAQEMS